MNRIAKRSYFMYTFALAFLIGLVLLFFNMQINSTKWVIKDYNKHLYTNGELLAAGSITDTYGTVLAETKDGKREYNSDKNIRMATLHVVGDTAGFISTGAQNAFKTELTGYSHLTGVYNLKKDGAGKNIQLSINAKLSVTAMKAMGSYQGTVGIYNYKTGEIICAVSMPTYDLYNKPKDIATDKTDKYEGIYMNRFFTGLYTPGSTFKIVTACSAIDNIIDINTRTFTCNGAWVNKVGNKVKCNGVHGTRNFEGALNCSCNTAFAGLAAELGNEKLTKTAEQCGFNQTITVDNFRCARSRFDLSKAYDIDRAWAGIGQYTTMVNPCHMATMLGAIANRTGYTPEPTLIKGKYTSKINFMGSVSAKRLDNMLRSNVMNYYKDSRFPNLDMCGKTGTAEVSTGRPHAWFVGYSQRPDLPFVIIVVLENSGGTGIGTAVPVANQVMQEALKLYVTNYMH
ncbi:MAG: penicillin-binding protein [Ruminococcaceae bacterium]|nr:penicillin-binding protein [Oscillospiraceae bacterium]